MSIKNHPSFDQISIIYCPIVRFHIYLAILIIRNKIFHLCISSSSYSSSRPSFPLGLLTRPVCASPYAEAWLAAIPKAFQRPVCASRILFHLTILLILYLLSLPTYLSNLLHRLDTLWSTDKLFFSFLFFLRERKRNILSRISFTLQLG